MRDEAKASEYVDCSGDLRIFASLLRYIVEADEVHLYGEEVSELFEEENIAFIERSVNYLQDRAVRYSDDGYVNELKGTLDQTDPLSLDSNVLAQIVTNSFECYEIVISEIGKETEQYLASLERRKKNRIKNKTMVSPPPWFGR